LSEIRSSRTRARARPLAWSLAGVFENRFFRHVRAEKRQTYCTAYYITYAIVGRRQRFARSQKRTRVRVENTVLLCPSAKWIVRFVCAVFEVADSLEIYTQTMACVLVLSVGDRMHVIYSRRFARSSSRLCQLRLPFLRSEFITIITVLFRHGFQRLSTWRTTLDVTKPSAVACTVCEAIKRDKPRGVGERSLENYTVTCATRGGSDYGRFVDLSVVVCFSVRARPLHVIRNESRAPSKPLVCARRLPRDYSKLPFRRAKYTKRGDFETRFPETVVSENGHRHLCLRLLSNNTGLMRKKNLSFENCLISDMRSRIRSST